MTLVFRSYDVNGEKSLIEHQCQNWFTRFRSGDFDLKEAPCSRCPTEVEGDKIKAMVENNRRSTTREIAEKLIISYTFVERHLKQLGYVKGGCPCKRLKISHTLKMFLEVIK